MVGSYLQHSRVSLIVSEVGSVHGMYLKLGQSLVDCSLSLCSIFIPVYLVHRTNFRLKDLWAVDVPLL